MTEAGLNEREVLGQPFVRHSIVVQVVPSREALDEGGGVLPL